MATINNNNKRSQSSPKVKRAVNAKSVTVKAIKSSENPFDKFSNNRKKFEVVNRRVKGEDRNVGRARAKAIDERKSKLLKDYHANKKSNVFTDKRFGEADANLSLEDKMFARFQKDRVRKARNLSSSFALNDTKDNILTHKGRILSESNVNDADEFSGSDDENENSGGLTKDMVSNLHFGGGFVRKDRPNETVVPQRDRLTALQEIVMKSKLAKLQKKELKEDQENERQKLDQAFDSLLNASSLDLTDLAPTKNGRFKRDKEAGFDLSNSTEKVKDAYEDSYDKSLIELAFDSKVKPTDRTKSAEEIAVEAREKLQKLEAARLKRMSGDLDDEDEDDDDGKRTSGGDAEDRRAAKAALAGKQVVGTKAKAMRRRTDDDLEEDTTINKKRKGKGNPSAVESAGDGSDNEDNDSDEVDDDDDEEGEDDDADEDEDEDEEHDEEDEFQDENDEQDDDVDEYEDDVLQEESVDPKGPEDSAAVVSGISKSKKKTESTSDSAVNLMMPHNIECPSDLEAFEELVEKYVQSPADMRALIDRILIWNSVHLPGQQGTENKNKMHNFMDILLKVFVGEADTLTSCNEVDIANDVENQLDFYCTAIFRLSQDVPDVCPSLWGRTLKLMENQLQKKFRDYAQGIRESCWPSLGRLLLLQLLGQVFSVSDLKNAVAASSVLLLCQCLVQCPVSSIKDLSSGLLSCSIILEYIKESHRFVPEILAFVHSVLSLYVNGNGHWHTQPTFNSSSLAFLRPSLSAAATAEQNSINENDKKIAWIHFSSGQPAKNDHTAAVRVYMTALSLTDELLNCYSSIPDSLPELFTPVLSTLQSVLPSNVNSNEASDRLPPFVHAAHSKLVEKMSGMIAHAVATRTPLQWRKRDVKSIEMKTPKYQLGYSLKKDIDPDQDRVKLKQLNRQLKRESKAAVRELRRDSDFLDQERFKEQSDKQNMLREERVKNYAWMEAEQATINQQVRKGKGLMKGGGSAAAKKPRVKR